MGRPTTGYQADREMQAQRDMQERGRRLRAAAAIKNANVVDGDTLIPHDPTFRWTRTLPVDEPPPP